MASSDATTVAEYLRELPEERRSALSEVRRVILENLPDGYEETMQYGMISYVIPLSRSGDTYNKQPLAVASLASQKNYMALYLMGVYSNPDIESWFRKEYTRSKKKLDMGKSCVRFRKIEDLPLDLIAQTISRVSVDAFLRAYAASRGAGKGQQGASSDRKS